MAIAAVHAEAPTGRGYRLGVRLGLYGLLEQMIDNTKVTLLNCAVAVTMVHGPRVRLALLKTVAAAEGIALHHRLDAVRAHPVELAGDRDAAITGFRLAAHRTASIPEQRYLMGRAARLVGQGD